MTTIIFKVTDECNSNCAYCDAIRVRGKKTASLNTLKHFYVRVNEYLLENTDKNINITWHGGEPLLMGAEFYTKALEFQYKYCEETHERITYDLQSNLTLFSPEFSEVLKRMNIKYIGSSYDPIMGLRGSGKKNDTYSYNRKFLDNVSLLEKEGFGWGVICVVTKFHLEKPIDIFKFLFNLTGKSNFSLNPVNLREGDFRFSRFGITPRQFKDFLGEIFPFWWKHQECFGEIDPFYSFKDNIVNNADSFVCNNSGRCSDTHLGISPDGTIYQCGCSADHDILKYGSIFEHSFAEIMRHPLKEELRNRILTLGVTECKECRFWSICHGGCPMEAWMSYGTFNHRSNWCGSFKGFLEEYFEPITGVKFQSSDSSPTTTDVQRTTICYKPDSRFSVSTNIEEEKDEGVYWINPIGGYGDTLMLSGILKQVVVENPQKKFNLIIRKKYNHILEGHPAIGIIGHPPLGSKIVSPAYWEHEEFISGHQRAYQTLAKMFGLGPLVEEKLYVPWDFEDDPIITNRIPWKKNNILICPSSESPRKEMDSKKWEMIISRFRKEENNFVQIGRAKDKYIKGSYSLLGITSVKQAISLLKHFKVIITSDNLFMHASKLLGVPSVVLWGPTDSLVYGYEGQVHLQGKRKCKYKEYGCFGIDDGDRYSSPCELGKEHCMNAIKIDDICQNVKNVLFNLQ